MGNGTKQQGQTVFFFDTQISPLLLLICTLLGGKGSDPCSTFPLAQRVGETAASTADATVNSLGLLH